MSQSNATIEAGMLIRTKLHMPRVVTELVERPLLIERLNQGLQGKVTLISAPAGYGKSTLAATWLQQLSLPTAWVSLDEHDNELAQFLTYLIEAIHTIFPQACPKTASYLDATRLPPVDYLAKTLINELAALPKASDASTMTPQAGFVLALDDYHRLNEPAVHSLMSTLVAYQPPQLHLVLIGRKDPARLPLTQLRARQELLEIRLKDLRFGLSETQTFLSRIVGLKMPDEAAAALVNWTEGWVLGLRLASLSLRDQEDPTAYVQALQGTDRYVMEYFLDEILSHQPEAIQNFLLKTSILDRFCGPLCEAVTGVDDPVCNGQAFLEWLERSNLFVVPLDNERLWYRYHHLFRDLLVHKLEAERSETEIVTLHRLAGRWLADNGLFEEAFDHALAANDFEMVTTIIESRRNELLDREQWPLLIRLLNRLPQTALMQHPSLLMVKVWATRAMVDYSAITDLLDQAATMLDEGIGQLDEATETVLRGEIDCLRGELAFFSGQFKAALSLCRRAHDQLQPETFAHTLSRDFMAYCLQATGQVEQARKFLGDFLEAGANQPVAQARDAWIALLLVNYFSGEWVEVERTARQLLTLFGDNQTTGWSSMVYYTLGVAAYEWNDLENALTYFNVVTSAFHYAYAFQDGLFFLVKCHCALGQLTEAQQSFDQLLAYIGTSRSAHLFSMVEAAKARLALFTGEDQAAIRWANSFKPEPFRTVMIWSEVPRLTQARALIVQGTAHSLAQAQQNLQTVLDAAEKSHNLRRTIDALAGQALAYAAQGDQAQALARLDRAVTLAWPQGYIRTFVDYGPALAELLLKLRPENNVLKPYIQELLTAFGHTASAGPTSIAQPMVEPLTGRELEILALLAERKTYKEIAQTLMISPKTVKTHVNNIYQKLGVNRRQQATDRARTLGLLPFSDNPQQPK